MSVDRYLSNLNKLKLNSPREGRPRTAAHGLHINPAASRMRAVEDDGSPASPETKRRRYNGTQAPYIHGRTGAPGTPYPIPPPTTRGHISQTSAPRGESLPRPAELFGRSPPGTATVGPPTPRQWHGVVPQSPYPQNHGWERMSLTLPPIQSPSAKPPSGLPTTSIEIGNSRERRSIEAMVMSMSFLGKLKILNKIAPPLSTTPPTSPAGELSKPKRGAIVAVEGFNRTAVVDLVDWLESFLSRGGEHDVSVRNGPRVPEWRTKVAIPEFLDVIGEWHHRAREMTDFIQPPDSRNEPVTENKDDEMDGVSSERLSHRNEGPGESHTDHSSKATDHRRPSVLDSIAKTKVVLLKTYALHACDRYACTIPISDSYSPADHWQWMATLWRGIPGADITVYLKEVDPSSPTAATHDAAEKTGSTGNSNGNTAGTLERDKIGTVEIKDSEGLKCLIVWKERGKDVEERALRRLGFELGEWVRTAGSPGKK